MKSWLFPNLSLRRMIVWGYKNLKRGAPMSQNLSNELLYEAKKERSK
jgi:hypothetical protein